MRSQTLKIAHARFVVTLDGHRRIVQDGSILVDTYRQSFVDEERLFAQVQEIGERLLARTGVTLPRSRWPIV